MVTQDDLLDHIRSWAESSFKKSHIRSFNHTHLANSRDVIVSLLVVGDSDHDAYISAYEELRKSLKSTTNLITVCRIDTHSHSYLDIQDFGQRIRVIMACFSPSQIPKDDNMASFLESTITGLKPDRDAMLLKQLLLPRLNTWFKQWLSNCDPRTAESVTDALEHLIQWSISRGIFGDGFLTREIITIMLVSVTPRNPISSFNLVKKFFKFYSSDFDMNESSVASYVSRLTGTGEDGLYGSMINEDDGIDSDVDEDLRRLRLERKQRTKSNEQDDDNNHSLLSVNANENDDVHPHKRLRFELGQIRDIRRFYAVENTLVRRILPLNDSNKSFKNFLDYLDVLTVCHPSPGYELCEGEHVNLAVRILESHKKLIVQELVRANMLVSDCVGDDQAHVLYTLTNTDEKKKFDSQVLCVFEIETEDEEIRRIVNSVVRDQVWFFIQEMQASHGVMVIPIAESSQHNVSVGLVFVTDEPYKATEGTDIDLIGPLSRVMLRAKKIIRQNYPDLSQAKKFKVRSRVVKNET